MTDQRTSKFKDVLNALVEMQHSPAYAVRREVLSRAELLIADLEHANIALSAALADAERRGWEKAAKVVEEMYFKPERIWDADTLDGAINAIRAQATQEEAND